MAYNRQTHGARQHHIVPLPAKCPELNPIENIWQFMRDNWLSNRIFTSYDHLVDHCCEGLEQAHRPAMAHHDHRPMKMGAKVMIHAGWYQFRCRRTDRLPRFWTLGSFLRNE